MSSQKENKPIHISKHPNYQKLQKSKASHTHSSEGEQATTEEKKQGPVAGNPPPTEESSPYYAMSSVAVGVCLLLLGIPVVNQYFQTGDSSDRNVASIQKARENEKQLLHLIKTGRRTLASKGRKPNEQDVFSLQLLNANYKVEWEKSGKLIQANLIEDKQAVTAPAFKKIIKRLPTIFPEHTQVLQAGSDPSSFPAESRKSYELQNAEGQQTAKVVVLRDKNGGLLSIYVTHF